MNPISLSWAIAAAHSRCHSGVPMVRFACLFAIAAAALCGEARAAAPITDPSTLNIGLNCQWQQRCIRDHQRAKKRALKYIRKYAPPTWRVELCNRNAGRGRLRVDWVGFDHCVRNSALLPPPPPPPRKKRQKRR